MYPHSFPHGNHKLVSYICVSISVLEISSFVPFFFNIPHISDITRYLSLPVIQTSSHFIFSDTSTLLCTLYNPNSGQSTFPFNPNFLN